MHFASWLIGCLAFVVGCHRRVDHDERALREPGVAHPTETAQAAGFEARRDTAPVVSATPSPTEPAGAEPCPPGRRCDYAIFDEPARRPAVTGILVQKERHQLHLLAGDTIVHSYSVALGSGGLGQKLYEGDKITPIGTYKVTGKYPSKWHTYLAIDYPAEADVARHADAVKRGEVPAGRGPGSAIAIHGHRRDQPARLHKAFDWTLGCVSLDNDEIDEVAGFVSVGTPVTIEP